MTKNALLVISVALLLIGCAEKQPQVRPIVSNEASAKGSASFCAVAEYQEYFPGDSIDTKAQKASNNAKGTYLCGWKD